MARSIFILLLICTCSFVKAQEQEVVTASKFEEIEFLFKTETDSVHVINFWATWCGPCVAELPYFKQASETFANQAVKFSFVSLDFKDQYDTKLLPFLKKNQLPGNQFNLWDMDYNAWIDKVSPAWSGAIPVTVIMGPKGKLLATRSFESSEELSELIINSLD